MLQARKLIASVVTVVAMVFGPFQAYAGGQVIFDFETGDLQGWTVVEGKFDKLVCDREVYRNEPTVKYNKQGKYYLSTIELSNYTGNDDMTGVVESPVFVLQGGAVSFLVGGGSHPDTYVALCTENGEEVQKASGKNTEVLQRVTWDLRELVGKRVFLRIVDANHGGWGHVTFDDFRAEGEVDKAATLTRVAAREREKREKARREQLKTMGEGLPPLRLAIADLMATFRDRYPRGQGFLSKLIGLEGRLGQAKLEDAEKLEAEFQALRREALLANPLVAGQPILFVVRPQYRPDHHNTETMFQNDEINTGSFQGGGALKAIHFGKGGEVKTLLEVPNGIARDPEVSFDGEQLLFSMRKDKGDDYHVYEMNVDGGNLKQLTFGSCLSDIDPTYLPDGQIVLSSTREPKVCQCNRHIQANLFRLNPENGLLHQIGRNTLFEGHPSLLPDGRILYDRWEYVDKHFGPAFGLWTVNPDGTNQALYYGNTAWSPGGILDARALPGGHRFIATFSSCHDRPWGALALADPRRGFYGITPIIKSWPPDLSELLKQGYDSFVRLAVKYEDPYPLSDKYFLCSRTVSGETMGIFLLDLFGNEVLLHTEGPGCYDPMPIGPRERPPVIPPHVDLAKEEGVFFVADVYRGYGMGGVERGAVKRLRIVEAPVKLFWGGGAWVVDATQAPAMNWNCTSNKRILGRVPVEADGSAHFTVPADKFVYFQLLDKDDMMIQTMRTGTTVQPGEILGCTGCHESWHTTAHNGRLPLALRRPPSKIEPWYGPAQEFNYLTEVQPVFDTHCVSCHDYGKPAGEKLNLAGDLGLVFNTSYLELRRKSAVRWFPDPPSGEKVLVKAVDDGPAEVLPPYSWGSHRSRLVDVLHKEHYGVKLDKESFDRIVTWIDMNAPYYGSYASAYAENAFGRSPLGNEALRRLSELTGTEVGTQQSEMRGSQVSFTRPELSPCLAGFKDKGDPKYVEALAIIRAGQELLARIPRADMPNSKLVGVDCKRQEKYEAYLKSEAEGRKALLKEREGS